MLLKQSQKNDCEEWAHRHAKNYSGTRYNNGVDTLRMIFDIAISDGLIFENPASGSAKRTASTKRLELPTREQFAALVRNMREAGGWCSVQAGDFVEFMAYSGCSITEAINVKWSDVNETDIWIYGHAVIGTSRTFSGRATSDRAGARPSYQRKVYMLRIVL